MGRKIGLSIASIFLIWQSYELLKNIDKMEFSSWLLTLFMAWLIYLFITGIFAFAGFAFPTQKLLPDAYYQIYRPKTLKKIYNLLNVELFRKALLATIWRPQKQRQKYFNGRYISSGSVPSNWRFLPLSSKS